MFDGIGDDGVAEQGVMTIEAGPKVGIGRLLQSTSQPQRESSLCAAAYRELQALRETQLCLRTLHSISRGWRENHRPPV